MADVPGALLDISPIPAPPSPSPNNKGRTIVPKKRATGAFTYGMAAQVGGSFGAGAGPGPPINTPTDHPGELREATPGDTWFNAVHLLPRDPGIQFGNIVTTVSAEFEIFNAFRVSSDLTNVVNNAGAGVTIPNLPGLPATQGAFTSLLDPASTRFTPVKLSVEATPDGPSTFDNTIDFTWGPGGVLMLRVSGQRIVFVPAEWERPFTEVMEFRTSVLRKFSGADQRISERKQPRQILNVKYRSSDLQMRELRILMFDWQGRQFAVPLWQERMKLTQAASATSTVNVTSTADLDLRVGGLAAVFKDSRTFDVLEVNTVNPNSIVFASPVSNSYDVGDLVMPVRTAYVNGDIEGQRWPVTLEDLDVQWLVSDNDTGALTGDTTPFNTYNSKVLLDDCNLLDGETMAQTLSLRVASFDNEVGLVFRDPVWDRNRRSFRKGFHCDTRARIKEVRRLLIALRGRQVSFYMPTFSEDLVATQGITSGTNSLVVENVNYTRFVGTTPREHKKTIRLTFDDDTTEINEVTAAVETSGTEETLTLQNNWTVTKTVSEIVRIEFVELVNLASDAVDIEHERIGRADVFFPVEVVYDV